MPTSTNPDHSPQFVSESPLLVHTACLGRYLRPERVSLMQHDPERAISEIEVADRMYELQVTGSTAIIPICGPIEYRTSVWGWLYGGTSSQLIGKLYQKAIDDPAITKIVFDVDSPGGVYSGTPEIAQQIFAQRGVKPSSAVANPMCASGALWLARSVERFCVIGSGQAGSIGAVTLAESYAKYYEEMGIDLRVIRSPERKAEGFSGEPISDDYVTHAQGVIDAIAVEFQQWIAKCCGQKATVVARDYGRGRMMSAKECIDVGLADAISSLEKECGQPKARVARGPRAQIAVSNYLPPRT